MNDSGGLNGHIPDHAAVLQMLEGRANRWAKLESRLSFASGYFFLGCALVAIGFGLKLMM